ncbi:hypothetical protein LTR08_002629 [Meristemomyces frigidus]|nr:hypothetical protein LTR08_002629 [Meristemomyces frigidus]
MATRERHERTAKGKTPVYRSDPVDENDESPITYEFADNDEDEDESDGGSQDAGEDEEEGSEEEIDEQPLAGRRLVRGQKGMRASRLKKARDTSDKTGLWAKDSIAGGLEDLEARDRLLFEQLPAEAESSVHLTNVLVFKSAVEKLDWSKTATGPQSTLPDDLNRILALPANRRLESRFAKGSKSILVAREGSKSFEKRTLHTG